MEYDDKYSTCFAHIPETDIAVSLNIVRMDSSPLRTNVATALQEITIGAGPNQ